MPGTYSSDALIAVVDGLKRPIPSLLQRYFPVQIAQATEFINFDIITKTRRIAPFVHPRVAGKVVKDQGYQTKTFQPAYIKPKSEFDPAKALERIAGEPIGGNLSPQQRQDANVRRMLQEHLDMIDRRLEVMAAEALRLGQVTVVGDEYPSSVVDFTRDAALEPATLGGTNVWDNAASTPLDNLLDWSLLTLQKSGVAARDAIMGVDAYKNFRKHASVTTRLDTRNVTGATAAPNAPFEEGLTFVGVIDGFNIFVYAGWYVDPADGVEKEIFGAKEVVLASSGIEGVQAFGAIKDAAASGGLVAVPYFPKMWVDNDPGVQWLMTQSAPLIVPTRVNASLKAQVLA